MQIQEQRQGAIVVLAPEGRLDVSNAPHLQAHVARLLEDGETALLLDLTDVAYLSSMGLAACLKSGKLARAAGAQLVLCGLQAMVRNVFEVSGFLRLFAIYEARGQALEALAGGDSA